jgi:hydroxymethylpyrimidine pyrophosphatase-like HAD family hydrolase
MLFISDLDQTLIYSHNVINNLNGTVPLDLHPAEIYDKKVYSYQTLKAKNYCNILINNRCFIPATTRTIKQYKRIKLNSKKIPWEIVYNGAVILNEGFIDKEWNNQVMSRLKNSLDVISMEVKLLSYLKEPWLIKMKRAGSWFFYFIVDRKKLDNKKINELDNLATINNWVFSQQGRKLFFIPKYVNKKEAAFYILDKFNDFDYVAAGDSKLDIELLDKAIEGYIPSHGELYKSYTNKQYMNNNVLIMESKGVFCGEEILKRAIRKIGLPLVVRKKYK